jgi:hypothetical protein
MKGLYRSILAAGVIFLAASSAVFAQYRPPAAKREAVDDEESFERSVDLKRFRKGHYEWDTQEFIASGFTALHREHEQILKELREIKAALARAEEKK